MRDGVMMRADIEAVAKKAAGKIGRRCWSVPQEDLAQEGLLVAMTAQKHYDPEKGPLLGYLYRAVTRHLINYVYEAGSPVTYKHRRSELGTVRSAEITELSPLMADVDTAAEVAQIEWQNAVLSRLLDLAGADGYVVTCVVNDTLPTEVAKRTGRKLMTVLTAVGRLREVMAEDETLKYLWSEGP